MTRLPRLWLVVVTVGLAVASLVAGGWYVLGEERRTARLLAGLIESRTGLPLTIERAATDGWRLRLRGLHVPARPRFPLEIRIKELEVAGGPMPLVAPAGRRLSVVVVSPAVTVSAPGGGGPPDPAIVEQVRALARQLLDWPGGLTLRVVDGELRGDGAAYHFDLTTEKDATSVTLRVAIGPAGRPRAATLEAHATHGPAGAVDLRIDVAGTPAGFGDAWPGALPVPSTIGARATVRIVVGGDAMAQLRATAGNPARTPVVLDLTARYDVRAGAITIPRYTLGGPQGMDFEGTASAVPAENGFRVAATLRGAVEGTAVDGGLAYDTGTGRTEATVDLGGLDTRRVAERFDLVAPPGEPSAERVRLVVEGTLGEGERHASIAVSARAMRTKLVPALVADADLAARLRLAGPGETGLVGAVESTRLTLWREREPVLVLTAASRGRGLWPVHLTAAVEDLGRLASILPLRPTLTGALRVAGEIVHGESWAFRGSLEANVPRVTVVAGAPLTIVGTRLLVPVRWGVPEVSPPGTVHIARVSTYGLGIEDLSTQAMLDGRRLLLPDVRFSHYGGQGRGWVELSMEPGKAPLRARFEGEHIDLARLARAAGTDLVRLTGALGYLITTHYAADVGLSVLARIHSEGHGEIGVEAIQKLIESAAVQRETTGMLRRTLEALRVLEYETLDGELRLAHGTGQIDVSLRGRKRFGIFAAAIEAINVQNVPVDVLAHALRKGKRP